MDWRCSSQEPSKTGRVGLLEPEMGRSMNTNTGTKEPPRTGETLGNTAQEVLGGNWEDSPTQVAWEVLRVNWEDTQTQAAWQVLGGNWEDSPI